MALRFRIGRREDENDDRCFQRLRLGLLALVAAARLLAGFAGGAAAANYTALGDSYAAGPLIPNPLLPLGCLKSSNNYAHLAAPEDRADPARRQLQRRQDRST